MYQGIHIDIVRVPNVEFQTKLEGSVKVPGLELQGCRILRLQGSKVRSNMVQRLQCSRNPMSQVSMVSKLQDFRAGQTIWPVKFAKKISMEKEQPTTPATTDQGVPTNSKQFCNAVPEIAPNAINFNCRNLCQD